ncbi:MAG: NAD(P)/FAD-dependent oxidoreductase [Planctomycetaceae bacterium]
MTERVSAAVIGGGVIGLACARALRRRDVDVVVLEAAPAVGHGSSARANGGFRAQFTTVANIAFSLYSIGELEALERETGLLSMHQTGYLLMTGTATGERGLRAAMALQRELGVDTRWLTPDDVAEIAPEVRLDGLRGGTFHARDGFLDPAGVVAALDREARALGADVRTGAAVSALTRGTDAWRVTHAGGALTAEVVVNAAGADARAVARLAGADVPVEPVRRNLALFLDPQERAPTPMLVDTDTGVLVRREARGGWVAAYSNPDDPPGRDTTVDPAFFDDLAARIPGRFPFLEELPLDRARCWAGLYPETPDHHAIVGWDPVAPGLVHAVGFGGHGVMHAPAAGRAVAELVADGACATFDLRPLRPSRFAEGDLVVETAVL